jgi:hypothetical protein
VASAACVAACCGGHAPAECRCQLYGCGLQPVTVGWPTSSSSLWLAWLDIDCVYKHHAPSLRQTHASGGSSTNGVNVMDDACALVHAHNIHVQNKRVYEGCASIACSAAHPSAHCCALAKAAANSNLARYCLCDAAAHGARFSCHAPSLLCVGICFCRVSWVMILLLCDLAMLLYRKITHVGAGCAAAVSCHVPATVVLWHNTTPQLLALCWHLANVCICLMLRLR